MDYKPQLFTENTGTSTGNLDFQYPTGLTTWAYRVAGIILLVGVGVTVGFAFLSQSPPNFISVVIDFILAIGLLFLRYWARRWTLVRAILGAILIPVLALLSHQELTAIVFMLLMQLGYCSSLILVLTGTPKLWRMVLSVCLFVIFDLGFVALATLGILFTRLVQP